MSSDWRPDGAPLEMLIGPRVTLRRWQRDDFHVLDGLIERNIDHLRPWLPWAQKHDPENTRTFLESVQSHWDQHSDFQYAVIHAASAVGSCGIHARRGAGRLELGYWLDRDHTGRGLMTEAAGLLTEACLAMPDVEAVEILHDRANGASGAIPARLGYAHVGEEPKTISPLAPGESGIHWLWRLDRA
jgi:ribosomal-protein-serine acetyltransferase